MTDQAPYLQAALTSLEACPMSMMIATPIITKPTRDSGAVRMRAA